MDEIRDFQTITTLLASVPKRLDQRAQVRRTVSSQEAALQVANAIAILAVRSHEDIAVAMLHKDPLRPEVIVCASTNDVHAAATGRRTLPAWWSLMPRWVRSFLFGSNNSTSNEPVPAPQEPTINLIGDNHKPTIFGRAIIRESQEGLLSDYFAHCNIELTFEGHLWMLTNILNLFMHDEMLVHRLLSYTLAACCQKTKRRFNHSKVSKPLLRQLFDTGTDLASQKFDSSLKTPGRLETYYDSQLATLIYTKPGVDEKYQLLAAEAKKYCNNVDKQGVKEARKSLELYNDKTYQEFYAFFLDSLKDFKEGVEFLCRAKEKAGLASNREYFERVLLLCNTGRVLQAFARGSALEGHLQRNVQLLFQPNFSVSGWQENNNNNNNSNNDQRDEELEAIYMDSNHTLLPLPEICIKWLKLLLAQIDAVDTLAHNISKFSPDTEIAAKILVSSSPDKKLTPWTTLFRNKSIFNDDNIPSVIDKLQATIECTLKPLTPSINGKELGNNKELSIENLTRCLYESWFSKPNDRHNAIPLAVDTLQKLRGILRSTSSLAYVSEWNATVESLLMDLQNLEEEDSSDTNALNEATLGIIYLKDIFEFFATFNRTEIDSRGQHSFKGTIHCEVSLADYIYRLGSAGQSFSPVIGVSRFCCPACVLFLELMATMNDGPKYITRGSHSVVSACSLPALAAPSFVKIMNQHFGQMLIAEIKKFVPDDTYMLENDESSTSDTSSITSSQGYERFTSEFIAEGWSVLGGMPFHLKSDDKDQKY